MSADLSPVAKKVERGERLTEADALDLFRSNDLLALGEMADAANRRLHGDRVFFNVNRHINPTNICVNRCRFCAFSRSPGQPGAYALTLEEVLFYAKKQSAQAKGFRVADVDRDGDGVLTPEELKKAGVKGLEHFEAINVKDLDIRGDGYVSREDLDEYFRRRHREAYARADADGDGKVHTTDFALYRFSVKD